MSWFLFGLASQTKSKRLLYACEFAGCEVLPIRRDKIKAHIDYKHSDQKHTLDKSLLEWIELHAKKKDAQASQQLRS